MCGILVFRGLFLFYEIPEISEFLFGGGGALEQSVHDRLLCNSPSPPPIAAFTIIGNFVHYMPSSAFEC